MTDKNTVDQLKKVIRVSLGLDEKMPSLTDEQFTDILALAKKNDITGMISSTIVDCGAFNEDIRKKSLLDYYVATSIFRNERIEYAFESICRVFEDEKIDYIPLKGTVTRELYPKPWMRTSGDIDILIHEQDVERAAACLRDKLNYDIASLRFTHDLSVCSDNETHIELHFDLIEEHIIQKAHDVLKCVWSSAVKPDPDKCRFAMSDEMVYFYHLAHMVKHLMGGGCTIRAFIDLWLFKRNLRLNDDIITKMLKDGGLYKFDEVASSFCDYFFDGKTADENTIKLEDYIFESAMYGNWEKGVLMKRSSGESKFHYIKRRLFLPYNSLKKVYPKLEERKYLTFFYNIKRLVNHIKKGRLKNSRREMKAIISLDNEEISKNSSFIEALGLGEK